MIATCLRCDWEGVTEETACPRCGAPLYRPAELEPERRAAAGREPDPVSRPTPERTDRGDSAEAPERAPSESHPVATSVRSVVVLIGVVFAAIVFLLLRGGPPELEPRRVSPSPPGRPETGGLLVYSVPDGTGAARLWRWNIVTGKVLKGPLIREPLALVNVRSTTYGWIGMTADLGNRVIEASVIDSLRPDAEADPLGSGDIATWARQATSIVLVDRGPLLDGCRREVRVTAIHLGIREHEIVMDRTICGDVLSAGRTSLGYFLTRQGLDGVDVIGAGYADAGVLLHDHGVIAISPGGDMIVTPATEFLPAVVPTRPARAEYDPPPLRVSGAAFYYTQFGGEPEPYVARGAPIRVDEVLGYSPGATTALVIGRRPGEHAGLWELPLGVPGPETPRFVSDAEGFTAVAYANDGTGFVVTKGRLWRLRNHRLTPLDVPEGAPTPTGPLVWIVREPLTEL
jgi:hypothetical protein